MIFMAVQAQAITCVGGTARKATVKGVEKDFCLSDEKLNWFAAYAWCDSQGLKMINAENNCTNSYPHYLCPDLRGINKNIIVWLKNSYSEGYSYVTYPTSGRVESRIRLDAGIYALCE